MTTPTPPTPPALDPVISFTHKLRDRADIVIAAHRVVILLILACVAFGGYEGWQYHLRRLARLEAQARLEQVKATNEHALGEKWKARAIALTDSVKVDTVTVRRIIAHVKVDTVMVAPAVQDGVTYSGTPPLVPIEVVSRLAFDSLGAACTRVEHDCGAALAAKDSVIAHQDSARAALVALNRNVAEQLVSVKRASCSKWGYAAVGVVVGRVTAGIR